MNKNYKTYLVFLAFTSFLWLALQFSKSYTKEIDFEVNYTNTQIHKVVLPNSDTQLSLQLKGSGLQLLKFSFWNNTIELDAQEADIAADTLSFFTQKKLNKAIEKAISYKGTVLSISKDTLQIHYDILKEKKVAIKVRSNLNFQPGYQSLKGIELENPEVTVIGASKILETIDEIYTEEISLKDLSEYDKGSVNLSTKELPKGAKLSFEEVNYEIEVEKLTEGEFKIPIKLVNANNISKLKIFPKEVEVVFRTSLKSFSSIKPTDFQVEADFKEKDDRSNLPLRLTASPQNAFDIRLNQKEVQYILIK